MLNAGIWLEPQLMAHLRRILLKTLGQSKAFKADSVETYGLSPGCVGQQQPLWVEHCCSGFMDGMNK